MCFTVPFDCRLVFVVFAKSFFRRKPFIPQFLLKTEDYVLTSLELTRLMMNGSTAVNEQLIGKFHVEKLPNHILLNADDSNIASLSTTTTTTATAIGTTNNSNEEQSCPSRFQMIRVDRNFGRGRWKVNDFEPPENTNSLPVGSSVTITENESNPTKTIPTSIASESTVIAVAVKLRFISFSPHRCSVSSLLLVSFQRKQLLNNVYQ